jgi:hypothetical protein
MSHLFIVDPFGSVPPLLHRIFPTHPSVAERVAVLVREGPGIDREVLRKAIAAGEQYRSRTESAAQPQAPPLESACEAEATSGTAPSAGTTKAGTEAAASGRGVPVYEKPDGWSRPLAHLVPNTRVTRLDPAAYGNFVRIRTPEGVIGYVGVSAAIVVLPADVVQAQESSSPTPR